MSRPPIRAVQDLIAWQRAMDLAQAVFLLVQGIPARVGFALSDQAPRAAVSIPANLAEGRGRRSLREYIRFIAIAIGSLRELETHLILANRLQLVPAEEAESALAKAEEVARLLTGLHRSLTAKLPRS